MNIIHKVFLLAQDIYIKFNSFISPSIIHNTEKHTIIKKALFYKNIENVPGDYLEFGVYEGTSLKGAATYWKKISKDKINFYGFDSFTGMKIEKGDEHPFYGTFDYSTDFEIIKKRFKNLPEVKLVKGFFQETLKKHPKEYGINKAAVVLIDCDLYSAAKSSFNFIKDLVSEGAILILDDYFNYKANKNKGVQAAFQEFCKNNKIECIELIKYGIGGNVFIITKIKK